MTLTVKVLTFYTHFGNSSLHQGYNNPFVATIGPKPQGLILPQVCWESLHPPDCLCHGFPSTNAAWSWQGISLKLEKKKILLLAHVCEGTECFTETKQKRDAKQITEPWNDWKGPRRSPSSNLLPWAGTASSRPGCSEPRPTRPWKIPVMEHPELH